MAQQCCCLLDAVRHICALLLQALGCTALLPKLWRWLATSLGLPLEAPKEATRGWDIASLQLGVLSVPPTKAATFGLFCRSAPHQRLLCNHGDHVSHDVWLGPVLELREKSQRIDEITHSTSTNNLQPVHFQPPARPCGVCARESLSMECRDVQVNCNPFQNSAPQERILA
jgi:hypothetical protein